MRVTTRVVLGGLAAACLSLSLPPWSFLKSGARLPLAASLNEPLQPALITPKLISQSLPQSETVNPVSNTLARAPLSQSKLIWHTVSIQPKDTLSKIFSRMGIAAQELEGIMGAEPAKRYLASLQPGQVLKLALVNDKQVEQICLDVGPGSTLKVWRIEEGFQAEYKKKPLEKYLVYSSGRIRNSLISSGRQAGLDQKIIAQMVDIFSGKIDFSLDLRPNDTFRVLYEAKYLEGEKIETGHIVAAEFTNQGESIQAVRYTDRNGRTGYFSPEGHGLHQAFLRAPLNFTRISSNFGMRNHPVLHKMRHHKGVDYSAPHGTPIKATGDAKVLFMGTRGGYGKTIELAHGARYTTLYAHLSRFAKHIRVGGVIKKGETIGYVGRSGLASGNHLHYEFRIDGIHRNPLTVALPKQNPIPDMHRPHFLAHAKEMLKLLDNHSKNKLASLKHT